MNADKIREFLEQTLGHITALGSDVNIISQILAVIGGLLVAYFTRRQLKAALLRAPFLISR